MNDKERAESYKQKAHQLRNQAQQCYVDAEEEGISKTKRDSLMVRAMEIVSEATRNETYASILVNANDPLWKSIELEKERVSKLRELNAQPKKEGAEGEKRETGQTRKTRIKLEPQLGYRGMRARPQVEPKARRFASMVFTMK